MILKGLELLYSAGCDRVSDVYDELLRVAKPQLGSLAKTYSSNVVSVVKPVEAASLQSCICLESGWRISCDNLK
ncbi:MULTISPECIES: hypothetical protein [unclassified Nostoc]|uniref:hypothetical protein n=1 Tax=unclassified Nostoc TaxID=2593658 RepID=UPI002AD56061|nr:hypothetical protein [Nostoc sp. DedQUE03]MDZ7970926.1 hypothetical protein [Nostoc sp. DedQUE03]MDZ8045864.1 hypothetical protein [Nostoc sp. DedQUE02]